MQKEWNMNPKLIKLFLLLLILLALLPTHIVLADTGPKPTMDFQFKYESTQEHPTIVSGILYECQQSDCSDAAPLQQLGPQGFRCDSESCSATAYGFAPYHKIEIEFSDEQTRQSNIFQTAGFDSLYTVTVRTNDLLVESEFSPTGFLPPVFLIVITCICAVVGVGLVVGLIVFLIQRSKKN
jgi:hypothetical protein